MTIAAARTGPSGAPPQTPEFAAVAPGLIRKRKFEGEEELGSPSNPGPRIDAQVALQRCPILRPGSR